MKKIAPILLILSIAIVGAVAFSRRTHDPADNQSLMALPTPKKDQTSTATGDDDTGLTINEPVKEITLTITAPASGSTTANASIVVKGKTIPRAEVFINEYSLKADNAGNFAYTVSLDEGENIIIVVANDENGNLAEAELIVNYQPSE